MWKMLPQSDTRKKNENQSKSSTSTTPLLNQDSQKVDEVCTYQYSQKQVDVA